MCLAVTQNLSKVRVERGAGGGPPSGWMHPPGPGLQGLGRWQTGVGRSGGRFLATRPQLVLRLSPLTPAGMGGPVSFWS